MATRGAGLMSDTVGFPFLGYRLWDQGQAELLAQCERHVAERKNSRLSIVCLNAYSYVLAQDFAGFSTALASAEVVLADGVSVSLGAMLLGGRVPRITGPDFTDQVIRRLGKRQASVFVCGSTKPVLQRLSGVIGAAGCRVVGEESPPFIAGDEFGEEYVARLRRMIIDAGAEIVLIGLTAPKQELLMQRLGSALDGRVVLCVGAAFDFLSGTKERAPRVLRRLGLEWVYRLVREPRRMAGRLGAVPRFGVAVCRASFGKRRVRPS